MRTCLMAATVATLAAVAAGRAADPPADGKTGLKVGEKAPAFTLKDQTGAERSLADLLKGEGKLAIVFHRSAAW